MTDTCSEFAIFEVKEADIESAIDLSNKIFQEMNQNKAVMLSSTVLANTENANVLCWHIEWVDEDTAKQVTSKWPSYPSTKAFQQLVEKDLYYGHFLKCKD